MEIVTKFIKRCKARVRKYQAERKLKNSGYRSWREYRHNRDGGICVYANHVADFYRDYKYIHIFKDYNSYAYTELYDRGPGGSRYGYEEMADWCEDTIRWGYRKDVHRVWETRTGELTFNDIGGSDMIFFAFKNQRDYMMFLLRWT